MVPLMVTNGCSLISSIHEDFEGLIRTIESCIDDVDEVILGVDKYQRSSNGAILHVPNGFFEKLAAIDPRKKVRIVEERYYIPDFTADQNDTRQRNYLSNLVKPGNWIVSLDAGEAISDIGQLKAFLIALADADVCVYLAAIDRPGIPLQFLPVVTRRLNSFVSGRCTGQRRVFSSALLRQASGQRRRRDGNDGQIPILLLIDVEPAGKFELAATDEEVSKGLEFCYDQLSRFRMALERKADLPVHLNWFLRMDPQIQQTFGRADWISFQFPRIFDELQKSGDELGLHTHAWRWKQERRQWFTDVADQSWVETCVRTAFASYVRAFGKNPKSFRFGDHWLNHRTVELLRELGFRYDLTVEPGPEPQYVYPSGTMTGIYEDYARAPAYPYESSRSDFLQPAKNGGAGIWMIPVSTAMVDGMRMPLNLVFDPDFNQCALDAKLAWSPDPVVVFVVRTGDLVTDRYKANFVNNLALLGKHPAVSSFVFATPKETIDMLNRAS